MNLLDAQRKYLDELQLLGSPFKLMKESVRNEREIDHWCYGFLSQFKYQDARVIKNFKILWRRGDLSTEGIPQFGVAKNLKDLQFFMEDNRLRCKVIGIDVEDWENLKSLDESILGPVTRKGTIYKRDQLLLSMIDKVVIHMTGIVYKDLKEPGEATRAYFDDYEKNVLAMNEFFDKANIFILDEIKDTFNSGSYSSWKSLVHVTKRRCGFHESHYTITGLLQKMKNIAMSDDMMESKIMDMESEISRYMIKDPRKFFPTHDIPGIEDEFLQRYPEEYTPIVNTLFHCLIYALCPVSETKFEVMENEFFKRIPETRSYEAWQRNRTQFYHVIDREFREAKKVEKERNELIAMKRPSEETDMNVLYCNKKLKIDSLQGINGNCDSDFRARSNNHVEIKRNSNCCSNLDNLNKVNSRREIFREQSDYLGDQESLQRNEFPNEENQFVPVCRHCSHHARRTVRHHGPFKGRGDKCVYNPHGKLNLKVTDIRSPNKVVSRDNYLASLMNSGHIFEKDGQIYVAAITKHCNKKTQSKDFTTPTEKEPFLRCFFENHKKSTFSLQGKMIFDSGSPNSIIHHDDLKFCQYKISGKREINFAGAGGKKLQLENYLVDVCVEIADKGTWIFKQVMVTKSKERLFRNQMIIGRYDMNRLKVVLDIGENRVKFDLPCIDSTNEWIKLNVERDMIRDNFIAMIDNLKSEIFAKREVARKKYELSRKIKSKI